MQSSGRVYIGTSGWAYTSWKPGFYPAKVPSRSFLEYYSSQLNSVEVNYTFRTLPTQKILDGWLSQVAGDFRFSFKAPQRITHILRLKNCGEALDSFFQSLEPMVQAEKMGVILFQLPPNFKVDTGRLQEFLDLASNRGFRLAFEFRHESWLSEEVYSTLRAHNTALCVAESEDLEVPDVSTANFSCYRLRKSGYTAGQLRSMKEAFLRTPQDREIYAYFKHEEAPDGAQNAVKLLRSLQEG